MLNRFYNLEAILYGNRDLILSLLPRCEGLNHYLLSPLHSRDLKDDGSYVVPHIHAFLNFKSNVSFKTVARRLTSCLGFTVLPENVGIIHGSLSDCVSYCTHSNCPDKVQYDSSEIISDKISWWSNNDVQNDLLSYNILLDLEDGLSLRSLAKKYGREFIINYDRYMNFFRAMIDQEVCSEPLDLSDENLPRVEITKSFLD